MAGIAPIRGLKFEQNATRVVQDDKCLGCSACVAVCPVGCLEFVKRKPKLVEKCASCGICLIVCPQYEYTFPALEESVFGRQSRPQEEFGIYRRMAIAKANDENILHVCQDGGVVTALLTYALETGRIDGAAVSGISEDKLFYPVPRLVLTPQEVLECAGTRYIFSPNLFAFQKGFTENKKNMAFVGTPCQIHALRKIEMNLLRYFNQLQLAVGLLCTESFTYEGLMKQLIQGKLGLDLHEVKKINIKGKILVTTKSGEEKAIPLKEAKQYTHPRCNLCTDFSAELADISVGGLGLDGWTFTILRTRRGEELFEEARKANVIKTKSIEKGEKALDLLKRLSLKKRKRG